MEDRPSKQLCYAKIAEAKRELTRLREAVKNEDQDAVREAASEVELTHQEAVGNALIREGLGY